MNWILLKIIRPRCFKRRLESWSQIFLSPATEINISRWKLTNIMLLLMMIMVMVIMMMTMTTTTLMEQGGFGNYNVWATGWTPSNFGFVN
jgi:hypothetical protein